MAYFLEHRLVYRTSAQSEAAFDSQRGTVHAPGAKIEFTPGSPEAVKAHRRRIGDLLRRRREIEGFFGLKEWNPGHKGSSAYFMYGGEKLFGEIIDYESEHETILLNHESNGRVIALRVPLWDVQPLLPLPLTQ